VVKTTLVPKSVSMCEYASMHTCIIDVKNVLVPTLAGCYDMTKSELFIQLVYLQFKLLMAMTTNAQCDVLR